MIPKAFEITSTLYYFIKPKDLLLQKPDIKITIDEKGFVHVTSNTLAKNVFIETNRDEFRLSDNYFDLLPNETKTIYTQSSNRLHFISPNCYNPPNFIFHSKSLYDTYNK